MCFQANSDTFPMCFYPDSDTFPMCFYPDSDTFPRFHNDCVAVMKSGHEKCSNSQEHRYVAKKQ